MLHSTPLVAPDHMMGSLLYRSTALKPPSRRDLGTLIRSSQSRNRALGITGMLLYEKGQYLQSLEGPTDSIDEVWSSIRRDPRHCSIEVLKRTLTPGRLFAGYDLKLLSRASTHLQTGEAGVQGIERLREQVLLITRLALMGEQDALSQVVCDLAAKGWPADALIRGLLEPAARALGDAWLADECMDIDVTIGLGTLRVASRTLRHEVVARSYPMASDAKVLVVAAPGEPHMLGASLMADALSEAGWPYEFAFPETDAALASSCRDFQPDVIVLALSDAMPRTGAFVALEQTVSACRKACRSRDVIISVCGRAFVDGSVTAGQVGADHARRSAAGVSDRIAELLAIRALSAHGRSGRPGQDMH